jgi:hypothetical protein
MHVVTCRLPKKLDLLNANQEHCPANLDVSDINGKEQLIRAIKVVNGDLAFMRGSGVTILQQSSIKS